MKKAKIMLLAIAVVGIAGSALPFKASKFGSFELYGCTATLNGQCSKDLGAITGVVVPAGEHSISGATSSSTNACTSDAQCGTVVYTTLQTQQ
jgi:hypothetical protein